MLSWLINGSETFSAQNLKRESEENRCDEITIFVSLPLFV
ncbi:hypothetical protein HMPREF9397_1844 [Streptococcus sanguinis SK1087]|uniref:Uncharacterized protein n=2 Tax=Streptococcus sanguinis TaxID=1305 RepID=F3SL22_STRSA|nr:hypothetical protein HMPREF9386_2176 [Streptococcus sanguinis SK330]EGG39196.1 hypothetical protein HMPREF9397_1844 [Streptococcus sanguinis SK1087]